MYARRLITKDAIIRIQARPRGKYFEHSGNETPFSRRTPAFPFYLFFFLLGATNLIESWPSQQFLSI